MVEKAQQTESAVGQGQDSIVAGRLRIVPRWLLAKDLKNSVKIVLAVLSLRCYSYFLNLIK
jgi:hypothetical protein